MRSVRSERSSQPEPLNRVADSVHDEAAVVGGCALEMQNYTVSVTGEWRYSSGPIEGAVMAAPKPSGSAIFPREGRLLGRAAGDFLEC